MAILLPDSVTVGDLCVEALRDSGALGIGQTPLAGDITDTWARMQRMLQQWERERWLIYHLVTYTVLSTGQITPYTVGPGGQIDVGTAGLTARPNRVESGFFAQLNTIPNGPVVYPLKQLNSMEDYRKLSLPNLTTFTLCFFYDPAWPLGQLYLWPWPNSSNYNIGIVVREQLPTSFPSLTTKINLPYEYHQAIVSNTALAIRPKFGIGTWPGDDLPRQARNALNILRKGNTAITSLDMPPGLSRNGIYNIFSDQTN